jgi:hypothetical protein
MSSRRMSLLPQAALHSDSEHVGINTKATFGLWAVWVKISAKL